MLLLTLAALAADRVEESDTMGMGSSSVAQPHANSMIASNPGGIGLADRYDFSLGFGYGGRGIHWQVGAVDTQTSPVAFGLIYSGDRYHPAPEVHELPGWHVPGQELTNRKNYHDFTVAIAYAVFEKRLSFGIGGSLSYFNTDRQGKGFTGNAGFGMAARPHKLLVLGLSARNLLPTPDPTRERVMEFLGGVRVGDRELGGVTVEGGIRPEFDEKLVLGAGAEWMPAKAAIRAGWRFEDAVHNVTVGAGGGTDMARVDVGLQVPTPSIIKPVDWTLQLSVRFSGPDLDSIKDPE